MANDASTVFDLVILGGGSGGYAAALRAAQLGLDVALIEKNKLGGTCLHNGCIPTKALLHAGEIADQARESEQFGVKATFEGIDIAAVHKYKDDVISGLYKGLQGLVASRKVTYIEGEGRLSSPTSVDVNGQRIQGRHVLLATGSVPRSLPGPEHRRQPDHLLGPRADAGPGPEVRDHAGRRRDRRRVRLGVEVLRHRRDHRRGPAAPGAGRGREQLEAAGAGLPQARHQVQPGHLLPERRVHRGRCEGDAGGRQDLRGGGAAGRDRPRPGLAEPGLRGAGRRDGPRLRPGRRVHADERADHLGRRRPGARPSSSRTSASPRASWWRSGWPA